MPSDVTVLQDEVQLLRRLVKRQAPQPSSQQAGPPQSLSSMYCDSLKPPHVAVVISGIVRAFTRPLVYWSFKQHVLDALGAPVTAFARLKLGDSGYLRSDDAHTLPAEAVLQVLATVGISASRTLLINDSNADFADCPKYSSHRNGTLRSHIAEHSGVLCSQQYLSSALGQLESRYFAAELVARDENRTRRKFDWVLFARPDLLWYRPLRPWCFFSSSRSLPRPLGTFDFTFLMPRDKMAAILQAPFLRYHHCLEDFPRCKTLEHFQRGAWRRHGVYPIDQHPTGLPALIARPASRWRIGPYTCGSYMHVPEQQSWEPDLTQHRECSRLTNWNPWMVIGMPGYSKS